MSCDQSLILSGRCWAQPTVLRQTMAERSDITLRETERPAQAREFAAEAVQGSGRKNPFSWEQGKSRLVDGEELT
jgi:hypothetical protein